MLKSKLFFLLLLFTLFASCCQFRQFETNKPTSPTPFQATLDPTETHLASTSAETPAPTRPAHLSEEMVDKNPSPTKTRLTSTEIFPQTLLSTQPFYSKYPDLAQEIEQIITQSGGRWHIVIKEVGGPTLYALLPDERINIASVVKVPLALLFFAALEEKGIPENQLIMHIQSTGTGGRTFEQLLDAMLVKSEEDATTILLDYIASYLNILTQQQEWQLEDIDIQARRYTAAGIVSLLERFYQGEFVSPTARELILGYLSEYTPNDETRIGILSNFMHPGYQIYNKRGSLLTPYVVADSAIIENPDGSDFVIAIFAYNSEPKTTYEILDKAVGDIALAFWKSISPID